MIPCILGAKGWSSLSCPRTLQQVDNCPTTVSSGDEDAGKMSVSEPCYDLGFGNG